MALHNRNGENVSRGVFFNSFPLFDDCSQPCAAFSFSLPLLPLADSAVSLNATFAEPSDRRSSEAARVCFCLRSTDKFSTFCLRARVRVRIRGCVGKWRPALRQQGVV